MKLSEKIMTETLTKVTLKLKPGSLTLILSKTKQKDWNMTLNQLQLSVRNYYPNCI